MVDVAPVDAPVEGEAHAETRALLTLLLTPGLGPTLVGRCRAMFGSAAATLDAGGTQLAKVKGISANKSSQVFRAIQTVAASGAVDRELDAVARAGAAVVGMHEAAYPTLLRHIPDPPPLLWIHGELRASDALSLGIVGSRKCSAYGREQADRFAAQAAAAGLCVVSGGAYGIDIAAHRAVLRLGGRTVAVIGSGLSKPYPEAHLDVFSEIARGGHGAVISELPLATGPRPENFPRRNRIISGLSLGILVVEAAKRSGALITARLAVEEHGRECMALPGRVDTPGAAGCHHLIREGHATLVTSVADVLDQLGDAGQTLKGAWEASDVKKTSADKTTTPLVSSPATVGLSESQQAIVTAMQGEEAMALDTIGAKTHGAMGSLMGDLTMLELRGVIKKTGAGFCLAR
ncbi:MAG: DNA-processing protein DprA [Algisphaera sp.]